MDRDLRMLPLLICVFAAVFSPNLVQANVISIRAEDISQSGGLLYDNMFGTSREFQLDFIFDSFAPTSISISATDEQAFYSLNAVNVIAGNGRQFNFLTTDTFTILRSNILAGPPDETHGLGGAFFGGVISSSEKLFIDNDTEVFIGGFKFDLLTSDLVGGGLSGITLQAFNELNNIPTPFEQGFKVNGFHEFFPDGRPSFTDITFEVEFGNYEIISNPATIPLPAPFALLFSGIVAIGFAGIYSRKMPGHQQP